MAYLNTHRSIGASALYRHIYLDTEDTTAIPSIALTVTLYSPIDVIAFEFSARDTEHNIDVMLGVTREQAREFAHALMDMTRDV